MLSNMLNDLAEAMKALDGKKTRLQHCDWWTERPTALHLQNTLRAIWPCSMDRQTPVKDAAVHRLAKSITQLTLCQVTTSEVEAATNLLTKASQKL